MSNIETLVARLDERVQQVQKGIERIELELTAQYVTREEFLPVRNAVFGFIGFFMLAIAGAIAALVIKK